MADKAYEEEGMTSLFSASTENHEGIDEGKNEKALSENKGHLE